MEAQVIWLEIIVERDVGGVLGRELGAGQRSGRGRARARASRRTGFPGFRNTFDKILNHSSQAGATFALPVKVPEGTSPSCPLLLPLFVF